MRSPLERSRYAQVALTYTRPLLFRIWAGLALVAAIAIALLPRGDAGMQVAMLVLGGSFIAWLGAMIAGHAKEQLADARSTVTPHFRTPHLVVAAVVFAVGVGGLATLVVLLRRSGAWQPISLGGYLALILSAAAALAWLGQLQTPAAFLIVAAVFTPIFFPEGRDLIGAIASGRAGTFTAALLAASLAALAALWWRMAVMHEEMAEYARIMSPGFRLKVQMTGDPAFRRESAAGAGRLEAWVRRVDRLDQVANVAAAGFWRRVAHWRIVVGMGRMPMAVALLLGAWTFLLPTLAPRKTANVLPIVLSAIVPGLMVAAVWPRRWYVLGGESLRPASRRQFVREQGAAMALELATTWLAITAATFAAGLLLDRSNASASPLWGALPVLAAGQILTFGIIAWILRFRAGWLVIVPMLLAGLLGALVLGVAAAASRLGGTGPSLAAAAVFAALGLAIAFDAYRRWLVTEFD